MQFFSEDTQIITKFREDVLQGLRAPKKYLNSKYFYDTKGDLLFQKIMHCPEYYLTDCELEIFRNQSDEILKCAHKTTADFDLVELGPGDAFKSVFLLEKIAESQQNLNYIPIDISDHIIRNLKKVIPEKFGNISVEGLTGEYLPMLEKIKRNPSSGRNKLILFLGSSLGNMDFHAGITFLKNLKSMLFSGDLLLLGLDLVKKPELILNAYNDRGGFTKAFNLNLLERINRELDGDFNTRRFSHFPVFDVAAKSCKSFVISLMRQDVTVSGQLISFQEKETIFMEISQKYDSESIQEMAIQAGFSIIHHFYDSKKQFVDVLLKA